MGLSHHLFPSRHPPTFLLSLPQGLCTCCSHTLQHIFLQEDSLHTFPPPPQPTGLYLTVTASLTPVQKTWFPRVFCSFAPLRLRDQKGPPSSCVPGGP